MARGALEAAMDSAIQSFRFNSAGMALLLHAPNSPVMKDLIRRGILVMNAAKTNWSEAPPSEPGEKPAVRTGLLRGSITFRPGVDAVSPYVDVGTSVFYAPFVELGTSRMEARPFLRPALQAARASGGIIVTGPFAAGMHSGGGDTGAGGDLGGGFD